MSQAQRPAVGGVRPTFTFVYNAIGLPTQTVDPAGITTTHVYDALGNLRSTTEGAAAVGANPALNLTSTFAPDAVGNVVAATDPLLHVSNQTFDADRRPVLAIQPDPGTGVRTAGKTTYDANGRTVQADKGTTNAAGTVFTALETSTASYDPSGNKLAASVLNGPLGSAALMVSQTSYDALNRLQCTAVRENAAVFASLPASACTQSTAGAYGPDHIVQFAYDLAGQTLTEQRGVGTGSLITYATYAYGLDGEVATVKDANGNLTTNTYDGFNRLKQVNFPVTALGANASDPANFEAYTFDAAGNRLTLRKRDGNVIAFAYDVLNRPTAKTFAAVPAVNVAYAYDLAGRPVSALYPNQANLGVAWTYDAAGRRISEGTNGRTLSFAYDAAGNPKTMTWPDGAQTAYAFDTANRLTSIGAGGVNLAPGYDPLSRMTSVARAGSSSTVGFDYADRMASLAHVFNPSTGNQTWGFTFTPAGQLVAATTTNPAYDWTGGGASTVNTAADGLNRDAAIAAVGAPCGATNAGYDCNGNLTFDGIRRFAYDGENRLVGETGPVTLTLAYDPTGRLQQTVVNGATTQFLYDGDALVGEYPATGIVPLRRYVHGPGVDNPILWFEGSAVAAANAAYLVADRQGSIVATANSSGAVTANYTYDAYGVPNTWSGSRFRYTGQIAIPEAGLYYYKARVYDPASGRFLQTDPVGYKSDLDLYAYVGDDPVNGSDPTGECTGSNIPGSCDTSTSPVSVSPGAANGAGVHQQQASQPGSVYSNLSPSRSLEQQKADFANPKLNGIPEAERQEAIGMAAVPVAGMALGAGVALLPEAAGSSAVETTVHGAKRIAGAGATRGGVLSAEGVAATRASGQALTQANGARVFVAQTASGKFNVVVQNAAGRVITTFENLSAKSIARLSSNYGWK